MYGQTTELGLCFQDSFGTPLTDSMYWIPFTSEELGIDKPPLIEQDMTGIFDEGAHYEGPNTITGDINMEAHPISLGVFLKAAMGDPSTVTSDALYSHTFKPRIADWDEKSAGIPCTVQKYFGVGSADLLSDMVVGTYEFNISNGEFLMFKAGFVGGTFSQQARIAPSYPTGKRWTFDQSSNSMGDVGQPAISTLTVTVEESIEASHTLNTSKYPSRVKRTGFRTVNVSGTIKFDNKDEYEEFLNQTERQLIGTFTGNVEVQSGYYDTLKIDVPLARYTEFKPVAGGPNEIEVSFSSKGVYSVDSATALAVTLTNTQAAY